MVVSRAMRRADGHQLSFSFLHTSMQYRALLACIFFLLSLQPWFESEILHVFFNSVLLVMCAVAIAKSALSFAATLLLGLVGLVAPWISYATPEDAGTTLAASLALMVFFGYGAAKIAVDVLKDTRVNNETLSGALDAYLLAGLAWAFAYSGIHATHPNAFTGIETPTEFSVWVYFSFVTMTTLGYGDISPAVEVTRSLAIAEALAGQIYLVVIVARLVSIYSNDQEELNEGD